jgi:hypothetical protein
VRAARLLAAGGACVAATALAPVQVVHACGQYSSCLPVLGAVTPLQVVPDGKPVHITLTGQSLSGVTTVLISPLVAPQGWTAFNDQTLLVTLPPTIAPGIYSVRVLSAEGGSNPSTAPQFQVFPAPPPGDAPAAKAAPTPKPTPTPRPAIPLAGVVGLAVDASPTPPARVLTVPVVASGGGRVTSAAAPVDIVVGVALGALLYMLWGRPRRLAGSWRSEPLRHLVGRPVQALNVGRICLYCGRMHFIVATRRDLWRAGKYCRPRCFISAEATPTPPAGHAADC